MPETLEQVTAQIEAAFAETPYPESGIIGMGCGWEGEEIQQALSDKHWKEITLELMLEHHDQIPCTTPAGFRFYLPAWMLAALLHYEEAEDISDNLIYNLSPPSGTEMLAHFLYHVSAFNSREKTAIFAFLNAFRQLHPSEYEFEETFQGNRTLHRAIEYWKNASQGE
jgi:hypothetical protein